MPSGVQLPLAGWALLLWLGVVVAVAVLIAIAVRVGVARKERPNAALFLWALTAAAAVAILGLFVAPRWATLVPASSNAALTATRQASVRDNGLKVALAIGAAIAGWVGIKRFELSEREQVTERFSRAVEQLGHDAADVRLGGIYSLEQTYRDSKSDRLAIAEVLAAYARGHLPPRGLLPEIPEDQRPAPLPVDIQAALTVLARLSATSPSGVAVDLSGVDTSGHGRYRANLTFAALIAANLNNANFTDADLAGAHLNDADLAFADLTGANLAGAHLTGANLTFADLTRAYLDSADLTGAHLGIANLTDADLGDANLTDANFLGSSTSNVIDGGVDDVKVTTANLTGANLTGANLTGAYLTGASVAGPNLIGARYDESTSWPHGFDVGASGAVFAPTADP